MNKDKKHIVMLLCTKVGGCPFANADGNCMIDEIECMYAQAILKDTEE